MPQYTYRGRDRVGKLKTGHRFSYSEDTLSTELIKEGISPIQIKVLETKGSYWNKLHDWYQGKTLYLSELAIFCRQMQLLHQAGVPIVTSLKQLSGHTRSYKLGLALTGIIEHLEKGQSLSTAMEYYPDVFTPLIYNIVQIGETTGHLSEAFGHLHEYLDFEVNSIKQVKATFRYPMFVMIAVLFAITILNIFVIPTFASFYINLKVALPWQTRFLIGMSNFIVHYGVYLLIGLVIAFYFFRKYLKTPAGQLRFSKIELRIPLVGKLLRRIILIRFSQSLSIILSSGISIVQGLQLVKNTILNAHITEQVTKMQEMLERGISFTQAISKIEIFSPLEIQIIGVGEKNGELSPALNYISNFHTQELQFDLKRMNDTMGPIMLAAISGLVLIVALGIYLPIWNMINLVHA